MEKKIKKYIYIAHPITIGQPDRNMRNMIDACEEVWKLGCFAYGAFLNIMWEVVYPKTEGEYLKHDIAWMKKCDIAWRIPGESKGADKEIDKAIKAGIPIVYSLKELKKLLK